MNEIAQWIVILVIVVVLIDCRIAIKNLIKGINKAGDLMRNLDEKIGVISNAHNSNSQMFAEEIAELQEELEIRNDEQIH